GQHAQFGVKSSHFVAFGDAKCRVSRYKFRVCQGPELTKMPRFKTFTGALLAAGAVLAAAALAQGTGRWTVGTLMPSARTEVAVAEMGGKIYVVGGVRGGRGLGISEPSTDRLGRRALSPRALP